MRDDYHLEEVDFDPFDSPHNYDVVGVNHDPFARINFQGGGDVEGVSDETAAAAAPSTGNMGVGSPGDGGREAGFRPAPGASSAPDPVAVEQAKAARAAGPYQPVRGLPQPAIRLADGSLYQPGPIARVHQAAEAYMRESGLPYDPPTDYAKLDRANATRIAQEYADMVHAPYDPRVRSAYNALANETMAQWQHIKQTGLNIDWITPETGDPYADNPRAAIKDIRDNNHWWVYPTDSGYGSTGEDIRDPENPLLRDSGEVIKGRNARVNDIFRIVHDFFGHAKEGHGFRAEGEENAWRSHMAMYSPEARAAATSELRGQNSWLNFGPYGEANRTAKAADTVFADQKIGLMSPWTWSPGAEMQGAAAAAPKPMTAPQITTPYPGGMPRTPGLMHEEDYLRQMREHGEWTGGRVSFAHGGRVPSSIRIGRLLRQSGGDVVGGGLETEEEQLMRQREGLAPPGDMPPAFHIHSPGMFGGARPVSPSPAVGSAGVSEPQFTPAAPAVVERQNPTPWDISQIRARAAQNPKKPWPTATEPLFATDPESLARTREIVPQVSVASQIPRPDPDEAQLPLRGRVGQIIEARKPLSNLIAQELSPLVRNPNQRGFSPMEFYGTGPVLEGMTNRGILGPAEAQQFMREYAGQGAATSPRTETPPNLRNASWLLYNRGQGTPILPGGWGPRQNVPGYGMMGMHVDLGNEFARGTVDPWRNPKPFEFREAWSGNQTPSVTDVHNITATLHLFDRLYPGQLHPSWFTNAASYQKYLTNGFRSLAPGDIHSGLEGTTRGGREKQTEYGPMSDPWHDASQLLGVAPAQTQSGGWFHFGDITGLRSPPKTIPDLLNDQLEDTARTLGVSPEKALEWWAHKKIPLTQNEAIPSLTATG